MSIRDFLDGLSLLDGDEGEVLDEYLTNSYPKHLVASGNEGGTERWRCLMCLAGGNGGENIIDLAVAAHASTCSNDQDLGRMRFELLDMISGVSEAWFAAGWLSGIEKILLKRGGLWLVMADQVGFPTDWRGLDGWNLDAKSALAHHGLTPADVVIWPASLGPRP